MHIQNLQNTDLEEIVFGILISFEGYFVKMPSELAYWRSRFQSARVDWSLSFGMFDQENLVGFIINGIDQHQDLRCAFNTGTGVAPSYRGQAMVDQLYQHAFPILKEAGIQKCALEVVQENARAIRVYERIGFQKTKDYRCFKGKLAAPSHQQTLQQLKTPILDNPQANFYAWDNCNAALLKAPKGMYESYEVLDATKSPIGFFSINPSSGYLPQFEIYKPSRSNDWLQLFDGISQISRAVKTNNVDAQRVQLLNHLEQVGLENSINQYEMELIF